MSLNRVGLNDLDVLSASLETRWSAFKLIFEEVTKIENPKYCSRDLLEQKIWGHLHEKYQNRVEEYRKYSGEIVRRRAEMVSAIKGSSEIVNKFKDELIKTLQDVAVQCRQMYGNRWAKQLFPGFIDKFGCVVTIKSSEPPYDLDLSCGYGLDFSKPKKPNQQTSIDIISKMSLTDLEEMLNQVLKKCEEDALKVLKTNFASLAERWKGALDLEEKDTGIFASHKVLKQITLKKEHEVALLRKDYYSPEAMSLTLAVRIHEIETWMHGVAEDARFMVKHKEEGLAYVRNAEQAYRAIERQLQELKPLHEKVKNKDQFVKLLSEITLHAEGAVTLATAEEDLNERISQLQKALTQFSQLFEEFRQDFQNFEQRSLQIQDQLMEADQQYQGSCHAGLEAKSSRINKRRDIAKTHLKNLADYYLTHKEWDRIAKVYGQCRLAMLPIKEKLLVLAQTIQALNLSLLQSLDQALRGGVWSQASWGEAQEKVKQIKKELESIKLFASSLGARLLAVNSEIPLSFHNVYKKDFNEISVGYRAALSEFEEIEKKIQTLEKLPEAFLEFEAIAQEIKQCQAMYQKVSAADVKHQEDKKREDERNLYKTLSKQKENLQLDLGVDNVHFREAAIAKQNIAKRMSKFNECYPSVLHDRLKKGFQVLEAEHKQANISLETKCEQLKELDAEMQAMDKAYKSAQLKVYLRQMILNNITLWTAHYGGGVNYGYGAHTYRIPHGVRDLITALSTAQEPNDPMAWVRALKKIANDRDSLGKTSWRYRLFGLRNERTTGALYRAIKGFSGDVDSVSMDSLRDTLERIPGMQRFDPPSFPSPTKRGEGMHGS